MPFFCYMPVAIPHAAMHAPKDLHEKWRKVYPQFDNKVRNYGGRGTPKVINPIAGFAAMMENLDNQVVELLALLKTLNIDENTIVVFASDNGGHRAGGHDGIFWNSCGPLRGYKRDLYEGGIRVPGLVRWPGVISPGSVTDFVSTAWDHGLFLFQLCPNLRNMSQVCLLNRTRYSNGALIRADGIRCAKKLGWKMSSFMIYGRLLVQCLPRMAFRLL